MVSRVHDHHWRYCDPGLGLLQLKVLQDRFDLQDQLASCCRQVTA